MPALRTLVILLVPLLAGCVAGSVRGDGVPTPDAPFTLTALDVGQATVCFRGQGTLDRSAESSDMDAQSALQKTVPLTRVTNAGDEGR